MMVQDRKTGEWYDPEVKFAELMKQDWFKAQLVRMRTATTALQKNNG